MRCCWILLLFLAASAYGAANVVVHPVTRSGPDTINPFRITVESGYNLYALSKKYNVPLRDLIELNRLIPPYNLVAGQRLKLPKATFHLVKKGDNLYSVAKSYGVDVSSLVRENDLKTPYTILNGQRLRIPARVTDIPDPLASDLPEYIQQAVLTQDTGAPTPVLKPHGSATHSASSSTQDLPESVKQAALAGDSASPDSSAPLPVFKSQGSGKPAVVASLSDTTTPAPVLRHEAIDASAPRPHLKPASPQLTKNSTSEKLSAAAHNVPKSLSYKKRKTAADFSWPVKGHIISRFGPKKGGLYNDGINISVPEGTPVKAADSGTVVYAGNELRGYGNLILLKHDSGYLTAYAHSSDVLVRKGESISKGQVIARAGRTGNVSSPQLHFSVRKGKKAIDPERYLPSQIGSVY